MDYSLIPWKSTQLLKKLYYVRLTGMESVQSEKKILGSQLSMGRQQVKKAIQLKTWAIHGEQEMTSEDRTKGQGEQWTREPLSGSKLDLYQENPMPLK